MGQTASTVMRWTALVMLAASGVLLFALEERPLGWLVLAATLGAGFISGRALGRDLVLIAVGLVIMSLVPITTDISIEHMTVMGAAMIAAVALPYLGSRFVYRDHAVRFPVRTGVRWSRFEWGWLAAVVVLGYLILPFYMIRTGVFENWPAAQQPDEVLRLFIGTNGLGIWDELFFICTVFALLRRHYPDAAAMLAQAVLFTSFLYELGFTSWGPLLIFPFAVVQSYTFKLTRSLSYVVTVHLLFDFVLFLVLLHAHDRSLVPVFVY
ncbi:MAG: hypothetical protein RI885_1341 [Actinomycetota bacterium]|jgi:membrane protease YdiL (CAAX protease family)